MKVNTTKVNTLILPTIKLEKVLFNQSENVVFYNNEIVGLKTGGTKANPIEILIKVDYKDNKQNGMEVPESNRLKAYDMEIHDAVISLYKAGNQYFSPNMILNVLSGNKHYKNGKPKTATHCGTQEILSSLERMKETTIEIDATEEGIKFHKEGYKIYRKPITVQH